MASRTSALPFEPTAPAWSRQALAVAAWLVVATLSLVQTAQGFFLSTDDAMRLAEVRDLMAGQSWFDVTQHRMNAPFGLSMHWSHLLDACIAGLVLLFRIFFDAQRAETAAVWTWPLLLLLPVYLSLAHIGARLAGRDGAIVALLLGVSCLALFGIFQPGRIDHHNVQLALGIGVVALLLSPERTGCMALAGVLAMLSLAIGLETLPIVALAGVVVAGRWVLQGAAFNSPARVFGTAFSIAAIGLFATATSDIDRTSLSCDTYSLFFMPIAVAGGAGLFALTLLRLKTIPRRAIAAGGLAVALAALFLVLNPSCLAGPYSVVDAKLTAIYLSRIEEVQPAWTFAILEPGTFISGYLYAVACFAATLLALKNAAREQRPALVVLVLFSGLALAIATYQVRGVNFAILLGLPGMIALVGQWLTRIQGDARLSRLGRAAAVALTVFLAGNITFETASHLLLPPAEAEQTSAHSGFVCYQAEALQPLNALPKGRIAGFVDQGAGIVVYTHHDAVAGPYHRGTLAMLDTYRIFAGSDAEARRVLQYRGIDYVVTCPASPDYAFYAKQDSQGLIARVERRNTPAWLAPAYATRELQVFRVLKNKL